MPNNNANTDHKSCIAGDALVEILSTISVDTFIINIIYSPERLSLSYVLKQTDNVASYDKGKHDTND